MDIALALRAGLEYWDFRKAMGLLVTRPPTRLDTRRGSKGQRDMFWVRKSPTVHQHEDETTPFSHFRIFRFWSISHGQFCGDNLSSSSHLSCPRAVVEPRFLVVEKPDAECGSPG
jgi:hypothetical protein